MTPETERELKRHREQKKTVDRARMAMMELIDCTNIMGGEAEIVQGMTEAFQQSHRTLQQSFMTCFAGTMVNYAEFRTDARNESAVQFAKNVSKMDIHFPFI